jgi:RimJ/RimL family protein N-acetyltransferase
VKAPERIVTERLVLRRWRDSDVAAIARLNADPEVMRFFPRTYSLAETKARIAAWSEAFETRHYSPWAVELPGVAACIGLVGAAQVGAELPFAGVMEMAWRIDRLFWGKGHALEAARASLRDVFERLQPPEMVAYTARINTPSRRVMEKLGMVEDELSAFAHPAVAVDHPLRMHVVYRLTREQFLDGAPRR